MAKLFNSQILYFLSIVSNFNNSTLNLSKNTFPELAKPLLQNLQLLSSMTPGVDERYLNSSELIKKYGYTAEEYTVKSGSGYLLNLVRVSSSGPPVLLVHGLVGTSDTFLVLGTKSLAFKLADAGYDVWMLNCRGNTYSRKHTNLKPDEKVFWKFSFHEIGTEDLPATIDFILEKTNYKKLAYVGHSHGTTAAYIMLSKKTTYNDKLSVMISMAPAAWMSNTFSPIFNVIRKNRRTFEAACYALGINELFPSNSLSKIIIRDIFGSSPVTATIFNIMSFHIWGINFSQIDLQHIQSQISHTSDGGSIYEAFHYLQNSESGDFKEYDYGKMKNKEIYGSATPPAYPVDKITCKMYFFYSSNDWIVSATDAYILMARLKNVIGKQEMDGFNHLDYVWARDANILLYPKIIDVIQSTA